VISIFNREKNANIMMIAVTGHIEYLRGPRVGHHCSTLLRAGGRDEVDFGRSVLVYVVDGTANECAVACVCVCVCDISICIYVYSEDELGSEGGVRIWYLHGIRIKGRARAEINVQPPPRERSRRDVAPFGWSADK